MSSLVVFAFFLSGLAGLVYETIWTRYLGLFLGHRAYAQALVLVIFLGGTAAGALLAGTATRRLRRPLVAYAVAEAAIGVLGLAFHNLYLGATSVAYDRLFPLLSGRPGLLLLAQWVIAAALILPHSFLLGTTYPLVSAVLLRRGRDGSGRILALLYAVNGAGGAIGVLLAGFWLVGSVGLPGTIFVAGVVSLTAAAVATACWRASDHHLAPPPFVAPSSDGPSFSMPAGVLLGVCFATAVTSLAYEIAWTRLLSLVLGSALHSFELMLSAFVLGMAIGAFWLRGRADRLRDVGRVLGLVQWLMGAVALLSLPLYRAAFEWSASLLMALTPTPQGYALFSISRYALCLAIMLPATFCAGVTLPLLTDALLRTTRDERMVGFAYGLNTVGAIAGVVLGALVLMPLVGARGLLLAAALGDMGLGALIFAMRRGPRQRGARLAWAAATASLVMVGAAWRMPLDRALITSGVYRTRMLPQAGQQKILFYRDGRTATVSAAYTPPGRTTISTNGKVDASLDDAWYHRRSPSAPRRALGDDAGTQTLMPLIGLAHVPKARRAAVIGHGSGMSAHFLLGSPNIESVTTVEIEPEMILGSAVFYPVNRRVFDDPRSHFVNADARTFFTSGDRFDLILSEPSNPWVSGVSSLFTQEFYARAAQRLAPGGVFVQWLQMYETNDSLLLDIVTAVHHHFRSYALYYTGAVDLVIVAGNDSTLAPADWSIVRWPLLSADLRDFLPFTPQSLDALRFADRDVFAPLLDGIASGSSDFHSSLDRDAEEQRFLGHSAVGFSSLGSERFDPFMALAGRRYPVGTEPSTPVPEVARAREAAVAARVHARADSAAGGPDADTRAVMMRVQMFDTFIAGAAPPEDWQLWMRNFILVERNVHGLASGTIDENFYKRVNAYLGRAHAPPGAVQAVSFYRALAMWDFPAASAAADQLFVSLALGINWVPSPTLRDGSVVSKMLIGDIAGARQVFETLTPPVERASLRARLLDAHLREAEQRVKRAE